MGKINNAWPASILIVLCAVIFFSRLHTYREPLERDLTSYAVIAHEMLAGKALYRDVWDHKPPAIHVTYAAAEMIAGYGRDSIFLMNIVAAIATLVACYSAGSAAGGGRIGGCFAATLWALTSANLTLEANQPNAEVFLNALLTAAFAVLVRAEKTNLGTGRALLVGFLFALASLYKQVVVVEAAMLAVTYCACCQADARKRAVVDFAIIGFTGVAVWGLVLLYFFMRGSGAAFIEAVFTYNRYYSAYGWRYSFNTAQNWPPLSLAFITLILSVTFLPLAGLFHGLIFGSRRHWILLLAFYTSTQIAVLLPGWFFRHYYQLWLPPLAIGFGWTIALLKRLLPTARPSLSHLVGAIACGIVVTVQVPDFLIPPEVWSLTKYGDIFLKADQLSYRIDKLLEPGEQLYEWGNETGFYFITGREPPSGVIFAFPLQAGPVASKLSRRLLDDLKRNKPELVVASTETLSLMPEHPVCKWFNENYRPFSKSSAFIVLVRKNSELDRREAIATTN